MSTRHNSVRPVPAATNKHSGGFILPALVVFSLVLMSVGVVSLQYITSSTGSTQASHYDGVAKSAADAGIQQAMACLEANDYSWVGSGRTLHPNTDCSGNTNDDLSEYVSEASNGSWKSTFTVDDPVEDSEGMTITSRGVVEFYYAGDVLSETYEATTKVSIPTTNLDTEYQLANGLAVTKVTAGDNYTCAIANMRVYCSGTPADGRMGTGSASGGNRLNPTIVEAGGLTSDRRVTDLKSGYYNTCAITNGESLCWGRGNMGQIGDNDNSATLRAPKKPNTVAGFTSTSYVSKASSGNSSVTDSQFMCFLSQLKLFCTGASDYAQRGRPVITRDCYFGLCFAWYMTAEPFFTTGFPHYVNAGVLLPERVFGTDTGNEPSHVQSFTSQSQLNNTRPTDLDAGAYTACTTVNARVFCWGDRFVLAPLTGNNGNTTASSGWRNNGALAGQRVTAMDVGESTSCAVANGELYCWGQHPGNGTQKTASTVIPGWDTMSVSKATNTAGSALYNVNVEGVNMLADDGYCAYGDGDGFCWGNYTISPRTPVRFTANNGQDAITDTAAGRYHICFVGNGSQYCGGGNTYGHLGSGNTTSHGSGTTNFTRKSTVIGLTSGEAATKISAGQNHSCAIVNNYIYCWGQNNRGQLGVGDIVDRNRPYGIVGVTQPKAATQVSAGYNHTCGVISGRAFCWGDNEFGQLGNGASGSGQYSDEPVAVQGLGSRKVTSIDAGRYHTCAVADGQAYCWGRNNYGQIGITNTSNQTTAQAVQGLGTDVPTHITTGDEFSCAIANAYAYCWGRNNYGQIGQGNISTLSYNSAQRVPFELTNGWTSISAGSEFVCGAVNNVAKCWGRNDQGQLGRNNTTPGAANYTPANVVSSVSGQTVSWKSTVDISSGANHACAIANGDAHCWGRNASGQLGIGNITAAPDSRLVSKAGGYLDTNHAYRIAAGGDHTCIVANGRISCWGAGGYGQLGDLTNDATRLAPTAWTGTYIRQSKTMDLPAARIF